ncbi:MAG TPA: hypothetical protein PKL48_11535, partial [Thermodesulfobacteriota bacterium]|nr:hypothetical protein [Thermodesulfobacteriota bacterium]
YFLLEEFTGSTGMFCQWWGLVFLERVSFYPAETVDDRDSVAPATQETGDGEETKWLSPEIVGSKVINPGIYEKKRYAGRL